MWDFDQLIYIVKKMFSALLIHDVMCVSHKIVQCCYYYFYNGKFMHISSELERNDDL